MAQNLSLNLALTLALLASAPSTYAALNEGENRPSLAVEEGVELSWPQVFQASPLATPTLPPQGQGQKQESHTSPQTPPSVARALNNPAPESPESEQATDEQGLQDLLSQ